MKLDQNCFYAKDEFEVAAIKQALGLLHDDWVVDEMEGKTTFYPPNGFPPENVKTKATLRFCYRYGVEIEILTFHTRPNYAEDLIEYLYGHPLHGGGMFLHLGWHLDDGEPWPYSPRETLNPDAPLRLVQETRTTHHTNEYIVNLGRTYQYQIYWAKEMGVFFKYIKRIERAQ